MADIEFYYDFGSPKSYFVYKLLPALAEKHGLAITYRPILLGGLFKLTNNVSPMEAFRDVKGKLAYNAHETRRFVKLHKLPYASNPHFPVMTIGVMRGAIHTNTHEIAETYRKAVFEAMWENKKKMDDPQVIAEVLEAAGLPAQDIMNATQDPEVKQGLIDATSQAADRGLFGAPTLFYGEEMFFGKEGLFDLDLYLSSQ